MARAPLAEAVLTLIGSLASALGAGFILICYAILPQKRHFRHALIINLAVADFINGLNNSASGLYIISRRRDLPNGPGCVANGFIGQLSVQATDCNILLIAVVTLCGLREMILIPDASMLAKFLLCATAWILPIITSFTGLGLHLYHPVNGNWCWIQEKPIYLRYVLTHMWRLIVIVLSTGIYIYIYIFLRRHFQEIRMLGSRNHPSHDDQLDSWNAAGTKEPLRHFSTAAANVEMGDVQPICSNPRGYNQRISAVPSAGETHAITESHIKKTLLLNAYPIMYIILWLPGIANRIAEATGHPTVVLGIMQASTQYVGLANAITYGLNERVLEQLGALFRRTMSRSHVFGG